MKSNNLLIFAPMFCLIHTGIAEECKNTGHCQQDYDIKPIRIDNGSKSVPVLNQYVVTTSSAATLHQNLPL